MGTKMREVLIDLEHGKIFKKNSCIEIDLKREPRIEKEGLNNHQKRIFYIFQNKVKYLRSIYKYYKNSEIDWNRLNKKIYVEICKKVIEIYQSEGQNNIPCCGFLLRYDKDIIVSIEDFNSLEVSF